jgi:hypothetical protein
MMAPSHDYFYRFPLERLQPAGRCRVRIYERENGTHTVLLTELNSNSGESITSACERIATDLVRAKGLNPKTTRWIEHDPPHDGLPQVFDELHFKWSSDSTARDAQWQDLTDEQAEEFTGDSLGALSRRLGELESQVEEETEYERAEA